MNGVEGVHNIEQYVGKLAILYAKSRETKIRKLEQRVAILEDLKKDYERLMTVCWECDEESEEFFGSCSSCAQYTHCSKCVSWSCAVCNEEMCGLCAAPCINYDERTCQAEICEKCSIDNFCIGCIVKDGVSNRGCKEHHFQKYEILPGRFMPSCDSCFKEPQIPLEEMLEKFEKKNEELKRKFM